ncbi:hypothetical protein SAMN02745164_02226 [Marinitoga hydrogenitolerans DSM 16785]|uniref:Uncharacterized protein n=1 Tax=Marinitoga hydrogenitolerans (strain DSM 16785 / JCM 12826 / AT1271) TaxID=1122195 RepID=A0A1M5AM37_MARH1|nr:hypothetical protein [Marinitoga hydrogenitolerans]SHF31309.1 hypothetical protein SAMN02745164_02226 [Marinitoga hydrogenitolerans DSM 16785]
MKKTIILIIIGILLFSTILFAGDNDKEYTTDSYNHQIQNEISE